MSKRNKNVGLRNSSLSRRRILGLGVIPLASLLPVREANVGNGSSEAVEQEESKSKSSRTALYGRCRQELGKLPLVNAHEHLPSEEAWLATEADFTSLLDYVYFDMTSAGLTPFRDAAKMSPQEKWHRIAPYWKHVRHMGAASLCRRALSMYFEVDDLTDATVLTVTNTLRALMQPGTYKQLLKHQHNIDVCLNVDLNGDVNDRSSSDVFAPLLYTEHVAMVQRRNDIERLEQRSGTDIYSLHGFLKAVDKLLDKAVTNGIVGIKWHKLAYVRDIHYESADAHAAEKCLTRVLQMPASGGFASDTAVGLDEMRPFQDFMQHHLIRKAIDYDLPVQIHTGIFGGSLGAQITNSNPTHLVNLFLQYPEARFDLLHVSYPYMRELTALVKLFPNVYINTAWFELLSPRAAKQYLKEWISSVPTNKVFAFGADQLNVFLSCAYAETVRDNLAELLTDEVVEGNMSEEAALDLANCWLRTNAWNYFKLEDRWAARHAVPR